MKRICEFCGKEYNWEEGQPNWTKDGIGNGRNTIRSNKFCCYQCGIKDKNQKRKNTSLKLYGVENISQSNNVKEKKLQTFHNHSNEWNSKRIIKIKETWKNKDINQHIQKIKNTKLEKYGDSNYNNLEKAKQTNISKYGVENPFQSEEIKNKIENIKLEKYGNKRFTNRIKAENTCLKRYGIKNAFNIEKFKEKSKQTLISKYGVDNFAKSKKWKDKFNNKNWIESQQQKIYNTKKKNNTFKTSINEEQIYQLLLQKFNKVERQYKSELYPFNCDFYISELNLYIEYQGTWLHGKEPYNANNEEHIKQINLWKSKNTNFYNTAINVWTIRDPLKRQTAKDNNLNWIEFFNMEEFLEWYNKE